MFQRRRCKPQEEHEYTPHMQKGSTSKEVPNLEYMYP